jgi:hypothetical protein
MHVMGISWDDSALIFIQWMTNILVVPEFSH